MSKEELAKRIKDRVVMIGTALNHMESIIKYSQNNKEFKDAFVMLYVSLQNYVYIELFKIFDRNGKDSKANSIYTLMNVIETEDMKYHKKLDTYKSVIESIKNRRNHCFAHDTGEDASEVFKQNKILRLQDLLKTVADICCDANSELYPHTYVSNVRYFDDWCHMAINSLNEVCVLNDKLFSNSITKEIYEENLDDFINQLKQIQEGNKKYENYTYSGHNS